jgi:opacity protein-like surface antigen
MRTLKNLLAASAASLLSTAAFAADLPIAPPPMYAPPPVEDFGGWYLRGDIGFSNQSVKNIRKTNVDYGSFTRFSETTDFDSAGIFGLGVGYQFNNWFRADFTGQYRGSANFKGTDLFSGFDTGNPQNGVNNYGGSKSEWLFLVNAYADLGTWWCITPFVGVGIGAARVTIANFTDVGAVDYTAALGPGTWPSYASAPSASKWNFAWAAHAGLAYKVNPSLTMELAYSYVNMGSGATGVVSDFVGNQAGATYKFNDITSHDVKFGMRWAISPAPAYAPPMMPLIRKG